jgi:HD-like signal output (HDOD) protein
MVILGSTHAEVGAYLLGLWGLSDPIVEAVAFHHRPAESAAPEFRPLTAVHVADALEYEAVGAATANPQVDTEHLTMIGRAERLPEWRALAGKTLQRSEAA